MCRNFEFVFSQVVVVVPLDLEEVLALSINNSNNNVNAVEIIIFWGLLYWQLSSFNGPTVFFTSSSSLRDIWKWNERNKKGVDSRQHQSDLNLCRSHPSDCLNFFPPFDNVALWSNEPSAFKDQSGAVTHARNNKSHGNNSNSPFFSSRIVRHFLFKINSEGKKWRNDNFVVCDKKTTTTAVINYVIIFRVEFK